MAEEITEKEIQKEPEQEESVEEKIELKADEDTEDASVKDKDDTEEKTTATEEQEEPILEGWTPKTEIGKKVKTGEITDFGEILENGWLVKEQEIADVLLPDVETDLLLIGQAKGKFGGGQRRVFKQTQKKTKEGNKPKFATYAVAGNRDGYVGVGYGKSKETVPAREKSFRNAKQNLIQIRRGCGSWECGCGQSHSIPFKVKGKCGSVEIELIPAPRGTGLVIEKECAKIMKLAGIEDVWSKTKGHTKTKINLINACMSALRGLVSAKIKPKDIECLGIMDGAFGKSEDTEIMETEVKDE